MRPARALCLDLDDTLLDGGWVARAVARTCAWLAAARPEFDAVHISEANGAAWSGTWAEAEAAWTLGQLGGASLTLEVW
ncbi:MAG TPA: hypothetical protein VEN47_02155, partial [Myxococcota bacterium]|nr:hypothetical protein [Myxococcota bacterium]